MAALKSYEIEYRMAIHVYYVGGEKVICAVYR